MSQALVYGAGGRDNQDKSPRPQRTHGLVREMDALIDNHSIC